MAEACAVQTFRNVNQQVFDCIVAKAKEWYGIDIKGPKGCTGKLGIEGCWDWNAGEQTLQTQITKAGIVGCSFANGKVHELVTTCGATQPEVLSA